MAKISVSIFKYNLFRKFYMNDWALILGASSGFGAATCKELAKAGINIYGIHLDRKAGMPKVEKLIAELKQYNINVQFKNISATDEKKRIEIINHLCEIKNINIKILMHSLAFGALKPMIANDTMEKLKQNQVEMTLDVMANSLIYWTQDLYKADLLHQGSHIFAMTSSGGHRQWKSYGAVSGAKASLESYCRQLALELSEVGISVNSIQAGVTDTPALRKIPGNEKMIESAIHNNPGKRLTIPEDVAKFIALVGLSNESWMTGNNIRVDGGEDITG